MSRLGFAGRGCSAIVSLSVTIVVAGTLHADQQPPASRAESRPALARAGSAISPALEGWWKNSDGTSTILLGYFNRNEETVEIPVGPNNRVEPGGPDMGQPTTFLPGRQYGVFTVPVPRDFGSRRMTWTLSLNDQPHTIALWLNPPYMIDNQINASNGNTPPKVRFDEGPELTGAPTRIAKHYDATVGSPLGLHFATIDAGAPPSRVTWSKFRGPGEVRFDPVSPALGEGGIAFATATFSAPGEYTLRAQVNDQSGEGGGGEGCCWTNVHVRVTVRAR